jgi:hypothetical protein
VSNDTWELIVWAMQAVRDELICSSDKSSITAAPNMDKVDALVAFMTIDTERKQAAWSLTDGWNTMKRLEQAKDIYDTLIAKVEAA